MGSMRCVFVGDLALGDHPKSVGFGFYSRYSNGIPAVKASCLLPPGWEPDIFFGNLEFSLGTENPAEVHPSRRSCRGIPAYADFLQQAGFNALNLANNHIYQYGPEEFDRTLALLRRKGIRAAGVKRPSVETDVIEVNGQKMCLLAWSARPRQGFSEPPPYREFDEPQCYEAIARAARSDAVVVVSMHWGDEFVEAPSPRERKIARNMIDMGAKLVIGHHPHAVRQIEKYRDGLIAYSLGNFICDMTWNEVTRKTACLYVELADNRIASWKTAIGRIGDDYFPRFDDPPREAPAADNRDPNAPDEASYELIVQQELRRHQRLTVRHMLRNSLHYPMSMWWQMLKVALRARLPLGR